MFRIYRNLHHGLKFSVQERGRVIDRLTDFEAHDVRFQVGENGRQRVLRERRKNVHAFVVVQSYSTASSYDVNSLMAVKYNPYENSTFMMNGEPIYEADSVLFTGGRCYLIHAKSNPNIRG